MRKSGLIASLLVGAVLAALAAVTWIGSQTGQDLTAGGPFSMGVAFFTFVGALIVWQQPGNRIGWLFGAIGILWVTGDAASRYSTYAYQTGAADPTLVRLGAWYGEWYWFGFLMLTFSILPQVFPTGRPLGGRWRPILRFILLSTLALTVLAMFEERLDLVGADRTIRNPFGIPGLHDIEEPPVVFVLFGVGLFSVITGMAAVVARFRRSVGDERQQMKWFTFAVVVLVAQFMIQGFFGGDEGHRLPWVDGIALALVPISAAVAIFRYRLYDIDVVINRALVYGGLTAVLGGAYLVLVVLLQSALSPLTADSDVAIAGSTLAVAGLFRPARARVQEFIDRRFYRHKYDAAETLEEFATSLRDEVDLDSLSRELVSVVGLTMQPAHASLWLRTGEAS